MYVGRTEHDSLEVDNLVYIDSDKPLQPGNFYQVRITDAEAYDLYAEYIYEQ
jgi:ribosomal protein S12 methylthiotransferase